MLLRLHMLFMCTNINLMFRSQVHIEYVATLAHVVNVCKHKFDVAFIEYVATFAHVVNERERKLDVTLIICCYACTYQKA